MSSLAIRINPGRATHESVRLLNRFPSSLTELPTRHREVLAVVAAHEEAGYGPIARVKLVRAVARSVARGAGGSAFDRHAIEASVARVVGNLADYRLLDVTGDGIALSAEAKEARPDWNGDFATMVKSAARVFTHA